MELLSHGCYLNDSSCAFGGNWRPNLEIFRNNVVLYAPCEKGDWRSVRACVSNAQKKFEKLLREKRASVSYTRTPYVDKAKWVTNLSSRSLSDAEESLLKKGLNFAVTPTNIPATEIIAKVESAVRSLDAERAEGELLTLSFNRQNHRSPTSRRKSEPPLKALKRTTPA